MKTLQLLIIFLMMLLFQSTYVNAQSKIKNHRVTVKGTSTVNEWELVIEKIECYTSYKIQENELVDIKGAEMKFYVESIKNTKGKTVDKKNFNAFSSDKFPWIIFKLKSESINTRALTVDLKGSLTMSGVTNPIDLVANYKVLSNGDLQIIGNEKLKMTEFNMVPPKVMLGMIKVGDEVTIGFDITLSNANSIL
jgi:hypothetical protein